MALSKLSPENLIHCYMKVIKDIWCKSDVLPDIIHCDCQDTEMNNETECYFYFNSNLTECEIVSAGRMLCVALNVPLDCYCLEYNDDSKEWRVEIICELTVNGKKLVAE